jgi:hypothetical protein
MNVNPREETRLFRVPISDKDGQHLAEYKHNEQLYFEVCNSDVYTCATWINDDVIQERGFMGEVGSNGPNMSLSINRRTGRVSEERRHGLTVLGTFEGSCEPVSAPPAVEAKF